MQTYKPFAALLLVPVLLAGCAIFGPPKPEMTLRFHEQVDRRLPAERVRTFTPPGVDGQIVVDPYPVLSERDVISAALESSPGGHTIRLRFDLHGANVLREATARMRGRYLLVLVDDRPVAAVLVDRIISDGQFLLEADLADADQERLVAALNKFAGRRRDIGDTRYTP